MKLSEMPVVFKDWAILITLGADDESIRADGFVIERLNDGHITAEAVYYKVTLRVATDKRVA